MNYNNHNSLPKNKYQTPIHLGRKIDIEETNENKNC